jgi:hypothetical protein
MKTAASARASISTDPKISDDWDGNSHVAAHRQWCRCRLSTQNTDLMDHVQVAYENSHRQFLFLADQPERRYSDRKPINRSQHRLGMPFAAVHRRHLTRG